MRALTLSLGLLLALLAAPSSVAWGQKTFVPTVIPDPNTKDEQASFQVAEGLEVNLYAADPLLAKPIQMNFDAAGRLWIASSETYPQVKPGTQPNDKILVLEDTDGDGTAEKTTVFADGLLIPTGVVPGDGGAYVANSTEMLHLSDTDGDGRADRRRVMLSGFGTEDTHHIIHTFRWGPDGMMYFIQSIYIHSHIETPWGVRRLNSAGTWQFRPETMQLDVFARGLCNPWGHIFDYWGQSFQTDGAGGEGINYVFPNVVMFTYAGAKRVSPGLNPGSPKHCGLEVISGRHFPEEWQGSLVTNDFRAHRVCRFTPSEVGSGYASKEEKEIIKSNHVAFRPIDCKMGPDGALYIADWYNPIIQHGEVDFRDDRRDHTHGRIWRVTVKGRPLVERPKIVGADIDALLAMLSLPEEFTRSHAKLELKGRGAEVVVPKLAAWLKAIDRADAGAEHLRLEALWTYQSLDVVEPNLLAELLKSQDHHIRAAATRVLSQWHAKIPQTVDYLTALIADPHPQVRLEAVCALQKVGTPQAAELAMRALDQPVDRFIDHALFITANELAPRWLPALEAGEIDFDGNARHLSYILEAAGSKGVVQPLVELWKSNKLSPDRQQSVLAMIGALGGPAEMRMILDVALAGDKPADERQALLAALTRATRLRKVQPEGDLQPLASLLANDHEALQIAAIDAAGLWRVAATREPLEVIATAENTSPAVRRAALASLAGLGSDSTAILTKLAGNDRAAELRAMAIAALAAIDTQAASAQLVQLLKDQPTSDPAEAILAIFDRQGGATTLAEAASGQQLTADAAKLAVRAVRSAAREEPDLVAALSAAGGIATPKRAFAPEELKQFLADVSQHGDPARGEAIFRRSAQSCLKCHAIAGAGGRVGPDLVSIGASAQPDYLVESILEPSAKIKENYHSLTVVVDGVITSGVKVRESEDELVLRDVEDRDVTLPVDGIEARKEGGSLMPVGLVDDLTRGELVDLVRFLSELGKVGKYAVSNVPVVRRYDAPIIDNATAATLGSADKLDLSKLEGANWTSVYSTVSGDIPLESIPAVGGNPSGLRIARAQLDVSIGGQFELAASGPVARLWVDGKAVENLAKHKLELPAGPHTITVAASGKPDDRLRLQLNEVAGSTAQAQFVGGK